MKNCFLFLKSERKNFSNIHVRFISLDENNEIASFDIVNI